MTTDAFLRRTVETPHELDTGPAYMRVLSIDAWGNQEDGYEWNEWREIGRIPVDTPKDQLLVAAYTAFIFNKPELPAGYALVSDGFNMVIEESETGRPLYAFEGAGE